MINGWMHIACMLNGYEIACELHGRLLQSGLYDVANKINISLVGNINQQVKLIGNVFSRYDKYKVIYQSENITNYEWPCLLHMQEHALGSCFYIHSKGASNETRPDVPVNIQTNLRLWRDLMCHYVISKHDLCNKIIDSGIDACGPLLTNSNSTQQHFSGNFWWASDKHIKSLPVEVDRANRNKAETWITNMTGKFYNLYEAPQNADFYGFDGCVNPFGAYKV